MTLKLTRMLCLWAALLLLALCMILPLTTSLRVTAMLIVAALTLAAWVVAGRRAARIAGSADVQALLKSAGRLPVILVCGDGQAHGAGAEDTGAENLRVTRAGVYLNVPQVLQLPEVVARLVAQYPDCRDRLRVMFVVNPVEHGDSAALAGHLRTFCHQLQVARRTGASLPLMCVTYQRTALQDPVWFSRGREHPELDVYDAGTRLTVAQWQRLEPQTERLRACIQVNSVAQWLDACVLPHMTQRIAVCAIAAVPTVPRSIEGNLWQQWLQGRIALGPGTAPATDGALPLPDPLLHLLPKPSAPAARRRASVIAVWWFALAAAAALFSSAWQNGQLLRRVADDEYRYTAMAPVQRRDQPEFARWEQAVEVLREDLLILDRYRRDGAPLSLGFGLYRGEHLRVPLLEMIAGHRTPTSDPSMRLAVPIRLNSLSLFNSGSAQLKPDSTKVLIHALHGIKAQPGWLIVISGHTDSSGGVQHNLELSRARAAAVRDWLQRMGDIPDGCFAVQGFGDTQPIASNDIEAGRSANRRVDIRLVPEAEACVVADPVADVSPPVA